MSKCWSCQMPMTGENIAMMRHTCEVCAFSCCGQCMVNHYRKAHPGKFMKDIMPAMKSTTHDRHAQESWLPRPPARNNLTYLPFFRLLRARRKLDRSES